MGDVLKKISQDNRSQLIAKFEEDEVLTVVKSFIGGEAPGPDEFNFNFLKKFWLVLKLNLWSSCGSFNLQVSSIET